MSLGDGQLIGIFGNDRLCLFCVVVVDCWVLDEQRRCGSMMVFSGVVLVVPSPN
jgi:hypothetical protein